MRVRRKSELEATQLKNGLWLIEYEACYLTPEEFAAHYEPVPDEGIGHCALHGFAGCDCLKQIRANITKALAVSEEQPAVFGTPDPGIISRTLGSKVDDFLRKVDAHRATISPCDCGHCGLFVVEKDGVRVFDSFGSLWRGTEAEAKAKLDELADAGDKER